SPAIVSVCILTFFPLRSTAVTVYWLLSSQLDGSCVIFELADQPLNFQIKRQTSSKTSLTQARIMDQTLQDLATLHLVLHTTLASPLQPSTLRLMFKYSRPKPGFLHKNQRNTAI
ncbi:hypothetical protein B0H14DRAFT_2812550, partial [Mycena olivaceomarginata]